MKTARLVILVTTLTVLTACSSGGGFVSVDQKFGKGKTASGIHLVREGDTLYSIAWRYGLDYRELANANSISPPHTIYPGQRIDIDYTAAEAARAPTVTVRNPSISPKPVTQPVQVKSGNSHNSPKPVPTGPVSSWQWPSDGKIIGQFSTRKPVNKGIDLAGSLGEICFGSSGRNSGLRRHRTPGIWQPCHHPPQRKVLECIRPRQPHHRQRRPGS